METRGQHSFPDGKISDTFLSFAQPVLQDMPPNEQDLIQHVDKALRLAYTVWNAVVLADVLGEDSYLVGLRRLLAGSPGPLALVETLISRKRALFGDDARIIGTYAVRKTAAGFNLQADARDPYTLPSRRQ